MSGEANGLKGWVNRRRASTDASPEPGGSSAQMIKGFGRGKRRVPSLRKCVNRPSGELHGHSTVLRLHFHRRCKGGKEQSPRPRMRNSENNRVQRVSRTVYRASNTTYCTWITARTLRPSGWGGQISTEKCHEPELYNVRGA